LLLCAAQANPFGPLLSTLLLTIEELLFLTWRRRAFEPIALPERS
jgi:hypothetical protein